jgi:hypothetical protein
VGLRETFEHLADTRKTPLPLSSRQKKAFGLAAAAAALLLFWRWNRR